MPLTILAKPGGPTDDLNENAILSLLTPKIIFATGQTYTGDLVSAAENLGHSPVNGLEAADYICQHHADEAELKGSFKALLSSSWENANARISKSVGPYHVVTGAPVAENFAGLFSTREGFLLIDNPLPPIWLIHAVREDESGNDLDTPGGSNPSVQA